MSLNRLKDINFVDKDISNIESSIITSYESISGKRLYLGDPIRLFLQSVAAIIIQQKILIDYSAKQNLLKYSTGDNLEHVVALVGVTRLVENRARTTLKFTISAQQEGVITIKDGTRVRAGELYFKTVESVEISPGEIEKVVIAECTTSGEKGNGLLPGQITEVVDIFPFYKSVVNLTETTGGTDVETDEALRQRAFEAPHSYSTAGSDGAYAFWAKSVSAEIKDIAVISPNPGKVQIIPLGKNGLVSAELLEKIKVKCSEKNVKPLTDQVEVIQPNILEYEIEVDYVIYEENKTQVDVIQRNVDQAVEEYKKWQSNKLGRDINPSELMYRIMQAGAKRVTIVKPHFIKTEPTQVVQVTNSIVRYGGIEDE